MRADPIPPKKSEVIEGISYPTYHKSTKKMEFKQMRARLAKIPEAGEYLAYFPVSGIEYNAAIAA